MKTQGNYCAVNTKNNRYFIGFTKEDIVNQIFKCKINNQSQLIVNPRHEYDFRERILHSYKKEWTNTERKRDIINHLFYRLDEYGYDLFEKRFKTKLKQ